MKKFYNQSLIRVVANKPPENQCDVCIGKSDAIGT